jgi:hypothetical protein
MRAAERARPGTRDEPAFLARRLTPCVFRRTAPNLYDTHSQNVKARIAGSPRQCAPASPGDHISVTVENKLSDREHQCLNAQQQRMNEADRIDRMHAECVERAEEPLRRFARGCWCKRWPCSCCPMRRLAGYLHRAARERRRSCRVAAAFSLPVTSKEIVRQDCLHETGGVRAWLGARHSVGRQRPTVRPHPRPVSLSGGNIGQRLRRSCNTPKRRAEVRQIDHGEQDPATQNTC